MRRGGDGWRRIAALRAWWVTAGLLLAFAVIAREVARGAADAYDVSVLALLGNGPGLPGPLGGPRIQEFGRDVTALGSHAFLVFVAVATAGYLLLKQRVRLAAYVMIVIVGAMLINPVLKSLFDRPRPHFTHATRVFSASFPSGHAMLSAAAFLTLAMLLGDSASDRRTKLYFLGLGIFLPAAIGASRIYLGVHYPSDVMAGWCFGGAWAMLCRSIAIRLNVCRDAGTAVRPL